MRDKPAAQSRTVKGIVLGGLAMIARIILEPVGAGEPIVWTVVLPKIATVLGGMGGLIGARDLIGGVLEGLLQGHSQGPPQ